VSDSGEPSLGAAIIGHVNGRLVIGLALLLATVAALGAPAGVARAGAPVACPVKPSSAPQQSTGVTWAFTETAPPSGAHPGIASSYTHGRGSCSSGHGTGTICSEDTPPPGSSGRRELALAFHGGCSDHDHGFRGPQLHVLIARDGAQVNSA
jgi:hypothetical protein